MPRDDTGAVTMIATYARDFLTSKKLRDEFLALPLSEQLEIIDNPPKRSRTHTHRLTAAELKGPSSSLYAERIGVVHANSREQRLAILRESARRVIESQQNEKQKSPRPQSQPSTILRSMPPKKVAVAIASWRVATTTKPATDSCDS